MVLALVHISEVNLAVGRPISSQWTHELSLPNSFAVDGNYGTKIDIKYKYPLWWIVELKSIHQIQGISIFFDDNGGGKYQPKATLIKISVTSHIKCIAARWLINIVYLTPLPLSGHDDVALFE